VVEQLPNMHKVLGTIPSTAHKKEQIMGNCTKLQQTKYACRMQKSVRVIVEIKQASFFLFHLS
jgi:hypothetical protein